MSNKLITFGGLYSKCGETATSNIQKLVTKAKAIELQNQLNFQISTQFQEYASNRCIPDIAIIPGGYDPNVIVMRSRVYGDTASSFRDYAWTGTWFLLPIYTIIYPKNDQGEWDDTKLQDIIENKIIFSGSLLLVG